MASQHTRAFGREALAVYLAAALVVFGTWAASRYLILRKFENIEQNDISRNIEVMRKALVSQNSEIEIVSRDFRWLPTSLSLENYVTLWERSGYPHLLRNSAIVTGTMVMAITLVAARFTHETFHKDLNYVEEHK